MEGEFKIATLQGSPQQVAHAKEKLSEILQSHKERRAGGGGGGGDRRNVYLVLFLTNSSTCDI